ncbi:Histidine kinase, CheW domain-containing [Desulfonema magnum]|uniref:histidine kinase n=2 Tax=Desulfonema magnum TaxID=45655 RepID=A0A975GNZ3_9BACT|nr:Histidine kinase, CheW domain-containing [Desulfonema magnum]
MLDLFRSEVEVHAATLNDSLLALENDAGSIDNIEALMRAAHSIKGGARIVDLDVVVKLAHTMEDCFVAVQKGEGPLKSGLESEHIDILLRGVDMITRISEVAGEGMEEWHTLHHEEIDQLIAAIASILSGDKIKDISPPSVKKNSHPVSQPSAEPVISDTPPPSEPVSAEFPPQPPELPDSPRKDASEARPPEYPLKTQGEPQPDGSSPAVPEPMRKSDDRPGPDRNLISAPDHRSQITEKDRMVRVTAVKIERLMGLAGEVVVSSRWLPPFSKSLLRLKKDHIKLSAILERLQESLRDEAFEVSNSKSEIQKMAAQAREMIKSSNYYLVDRLKQLDMFTSSSENLSDRLYHEVIRVRMRPFSDGIRRLPRMIRDMSRELGKKTRLKITGESTEVDRDILEKLDSPLNHLLRNALDHGVEPPHERLAAGKPEKATISLEAAHRSGILMITVSDDGRGIDLDEVRQKILDKGLATAEMIHRLTEPELMDFLFLPGFSTLDTVSEISGRGVGLDVVHSMVHEVGGVIRATSKSGKGLTFNMELPLTLSVIRTFLVEITGEPYAFPLARIDRCLVINQQDIETVEDREYFRLDNKNIALVDIHDVLEVDKTGHRQEDELMVVVVSDRLHAYGLVVDKFLGECDLVVRLLDSRLGKVRDISAVAVMLDGSPVLIFDVEDLVRSIDTLLTGRERLQKIGHSTEPDDVKAKKQILVVDDSITVREMERKLLESRGYQVDVAVDGMDAWNLLRIAPYDMVISDIDMPRMNGFELITHIKQHEKLKSLPVMIVSYKNKEEDRLRGLEAGANYYLTKSSFQDNSFIDAVVDLIGEA